MWIKLSHIQENLHVVSLRVLSWGLFCFFCMSMTCLVLSAVKCFCTLTIPALFSKVKTVKQSLTNSTHNLIIFVTGLLITTKHPFWEDKTKSILFTGKNRPKADNLNISRGRIKVTQQKEINYLGSLFDEKSSGESMAPRVKEKIN